MASFVCNGSARLSIRVEKVKRNVCYVDMLTIYR